MFPFLYFWFCFSEGKEQGKECESTRTLSFFIPYTRMGVTLRLYRAYVLYCDSTQVNYSLTYANDHSNDTLICFLFELNELPILLFIKEA